jgi:hypothetical protein
LVISFFFDLCGVWQRCARLLRSCFVGSGDSVESRGKSTLGTSGNDKFPFLWLIALETGRFVHPLIAGDVLVTFNWLSLSSETPEKRHEQITQRTLR